METRVRKWGNSLAVRIPKALAVEIGLEEDSPVKLTLQDRQLVVSATEQPDRELARLLAAVTEENMHREVDTGPARGAEAW